ncbi:MAG: polysaccharide biosynthesis protein [Alphaproteobacteria bacterium]
MSPQIRRTLRAGFILSHDAAMAALSFFASLALRLGGDPWDYSPELVIFGTIGFTLVSALVLVFMQTQRDVWQYTSTPELLRILRAVTLIVMLFIVVQFSVTRLEAMPRAALAINWFMLAALLAGPRILYRLAKQGWGRTAMDTGRTDRVPVLLIGASRGAELFLRALSEDPGARYRVVGIVDTDGAKIGQRIRGVEVGGPLDRLGDIMARLHSVNLRPRRFIVTDDTLPGRVMAKLLEESEALGVTLARLPRMTDFRAAESPRLEPRPIAVEDLLGRPQQVLDRGAMEELVRGKRVLVTGAGGTIGGELVRQVAALGPSHLTLIDNSEYALYSIDLEIRERAPTLPRAAVLANVRDAKRIAGAIHAARPELVFHAAALKHVPIVEDNPEEGVLTNVVGTRNVVDACVAERVAAMVLISTDKAVNPVAVMGASKRLAESYCQSLNLARAAGEDIATHFITVRFGNVLGSTGSVVPLFERQLAQGGPLTVTHPDMTRYFMTVREAVELVLEATALGTGNGDSAAIYVLDMGTPVRIMDLAQQMIRLAGLRPGDDIKIEITGLRPGEKLHEELFHTAETTEPTRYPGVLIARPRPLNRTTLATGIDQLAEAARERDRALVTGTLRALVPEYHPNGMLPEAAGAREAIR